MPIHSSLVCGKMQLYKVLYTKKVLVLLDVNLLRERMDAR